MKPHYKPVATVPIFFYMKSMSKKIAILNGFNFIQMASPGMYSIYIQTHQHLWIQTVKKTWTNN